jgi:myo-inositol-1(or 4)-monophosphatase
MKDKVRVLLQAMREAGAAVLTLRKNDIHVSTKSNRDVVTQADLLVNEILQSHLHRHFPDDGWLSEETVDDFTRLERQRVWIVDPIDGTQEFIQQIPEYAISVALVENGIPIIASIFNPATNELFYAVKNQGAWQDEKKLHCLFESTADKVFLVSRSEYARGEWDAFARNQHIKQVGSIAYKLALVASGHAYATLSYGPKNEWDIAAGVLLVTEAGGRVTNNRQETIMFNNKDTLVDGIIATAW